MQNKLLPTTKSLATTPIGADAPLPIIDLDKITTIVADTYDHLASAHDEKQFNDSNLAQPLEAFALLLKKQHKHHILDIGCDVGWEADFLIARAFTVVGIDASDEMVQKASIRVKQGNFLKMRMHDLQFPPQENFDAIWSSRTLIHVPQTLVIDLLASWKRVLKPGGILGIGVTIGDRNGWETTEDTAGHPMFYHYFAEGAVEEALEAAGYQILEKIPMRSERYADGTPNFFVFAQRSDTGLDKKAYSQHLHYNKDEKRGIVKPEELEQTIALFLRAGSLTPWEQVNLCLLYDQLAHLNRANENQYEYKLAAHKLQLHLQTPITLSTEDFDVWYTMGRLYLKLSCFPQAVSCLELAHRLWPDHLAALVLLYYSYEGLNDFDKAIATAHAAEQLAEQNQVSDEDRAEVYHALGHFYVSRSRRASSETSVDDREKGDRYMELACSTGTKRHTYLGCLASLYNETKRYPQTIMLFDKINDNEQVRADEELLNELYFYHAEACMGTRRYDLAQASLNHVERYARAKRDWDVLAHVKLYQVRNEVKSKDVRELSLDEIHSYLSVLYEHEPSPYDIESFKRDREYLISILSAFYLIKQCLNEQEPPDDFDVRLAEAIHYMEKMYEKGEERDLNLLILADKVSAVPAGLFTAICTPHTFRFDQVGTDLTEREMELYRVWAVLALTGEIQTSAIASLTFCIGRFYREGYTIYIYDPKRVLPEIVRKSLHEFFVASIEEITQFTYMNMLYDEAHKYLSSTRSSLGGLLVPTGIVPWREMAHVEEIDLLPIEGEDF